MPARIQSALDAAGIQAARLETLWWVMFWVCAVVYIAVLGAVAFAVYRGWRRRTEEAGSTHSGEAGDSSRRAPESLDPAARRVLPLDLARERKLTLSVAAASGLTVVILIGLVVVSVVTGRAIAFNRELPVHAEASDALVVAVTGYQWWWKVEYDNPVPQLRVTTANELHLPVGRRVVVTLRAADVIHSFWVPNLHGKMDLVPGRLNVLTLQADTPGVYRGQCAEYCGLQHAHMAFSVVAEASDAFERWLTAQRATAPPPSTPEQARGLEFFERGPCGMCHTVRGTVAGGRLGPDLTHFASRSTIAAGTAPNTRDYLAGWLSDPQHLKPGARMPAMGLSSTDLQAVLAYMETLK